MYDTNPIAKRVYHVDLWPYDRLPGYVRVTCRERWIVPIVRCGLARAVCAAREVIQRELIGDRYAGETFTDFDVELVVIDHVSVVSLDAVAS